MGGSLAAALALQPKSFSRLYIGLVRAGEAGGALGPTLERLAVLLERQRRLTATIVSAMIYPALLALVATGSVTLLLTVVFGRNSCRCSPRTARRCRLPCSSCSAPAP